MGVISALCALIVVTLSTHGRSERARRSARRRVGAIGGLGRIPLGATGGLLEVVVSLAVLVPLGYPARWELRTPGGRCAGRRWGAVALGLAVLGLLVVLRIVAIGVSALGTCGLSDGVGLSGGGWL